MALILVADDEPLTLQAYRAKLLEGGHEVHVALRAGDAWEVMHRRKVDLVICDLSMPDGGGADLIRAIRARPAWAKCMVIVASASPVWHVRQIVKGLDVRAILTKAEFSLAQLLARVNAELAGRPPPADPDAAGTIVPPAEAAPCQPSAPEPINEDEVLEFQVATMPSASLGMMSMGRGPSL